MAKLVINTGIVPNAPDGDTLYTAFNKVNSNFTELYNIASQPQLVNTDGLPEGNTNLYFTNERATASAEAVLTDVNNTISDSINNHIADTDPHGDRAYTDGVLIDVNNALNNKVENSDVVAAIDNHIVDTDPHGDREYTDQAIAALNVYYKGTYPGLVQLEAALPGGQSGDYAIVDPGNDNPPRIYLWDEETTSWVAGSDMSPATTDALAEGTTNLYFTPERAVLAISDVVAAIDNHIADSGDPHGDREYTDGLLIDVNNALNNKVENSDLVAAIDNHIADTDPHGDRAYTDLLLTEVNNTINNHLGDPDPHGDREYTDQAIAALNVYYKGTYPGLVQLEAALPGGQPGEYAIVDTDVGFPPRIYLWDDSDGAWVAGSDMSPATTDALAEGTTNLYFTPERSRLAITDQLGAVEGLLKVNITGNFEVAGGGVDYIGPTELSDHVIAVDPHGDRAYTDSSLVDVYNAINVHITDVNDPHGDREYVDTALVDVYNAINDHIAAIDPHGDREYVDTALVDVYNAINDHIAAIDPHGDREYTDQAIAGLNLFYMGTYASLAALQTAQPSSSSGNWAIVDPGAGDPPRVYLWDVDDGWVAGSDTSAANTDGLAEGTLNLYFTAARARTAVIGSATGLLKADGSGNVSAAVAGTDYIAPDDLRTVVNTRTAAAWTVQASEVTPHGKYIVSVVHSGACTCELPAPSSIGRAAGDKVNIMQGGAGTLTITDGSGGASHVGNAVFAAQYEIKTAIALDGTTWLLAGAQ